MLNRGTDNTEPGDPHGGDGSRVKEPEMPVLKQATARALTLKSLPAFRLLGDRHHLRVRRDSTTCGSRERRR